MYPSRRGFTSVHYFKDRCHRTFSALLNFYRPIELSSAPAAHEMLLFISRHQSRSVGAPWYRHECIYDTHDVEPSIFLQATAVNIPKCFVLPIQHQFCKHHFGIGPEFDISPTQFATRVCTGGAVCAVVAGMCPEKVQSCTGIASPLVKDHICAERRCASRLST